MEQPKIIKAASSEAIAALPGFELAKESHMSQMFIERFNKAMIEVRERRPIGSPRRINCAVKPQFEPESQTTQLQNPLYTTVWRVWAQIVDDFAKRHNIDIRNNSALIYAARRVATYYYSWAVPSQPVIYALLHYGRNIVEIGAGTGYWAWLLTQAGASVVAVDNLSDSDNTSAAWCEEHTGDFTLAPKIVFHDIVVLDYKEYLRNNDGCRDSVLFACWPRSVVLDDYKGDTVVFVGEIDGCTAWIDSAEWREVERFEIPCWPLARDLVVVYKRA